MSFVRKNGLLVPLLSFGRGNYPLFVPVGGGETPAVTWSLAGDENFDSANLTSEQQTWFTRATADLPGHYASEGYVDDIIATAGSVLPQPTYDYGRKAGEALSALAMGLRATGYLGFLDGICDILNALEAELSAPVSGATYTFRHFGAFDNVPVHDEMILHGRIALGAYACDQNRGKTSPGASRSGLSHDYAAIADFWIPYLRDDFKWKWWSGDADGTGWDFGFNGGSSGSTRITPDGTWPFIWRDHRHATWVFIQYYHYMAQMDGAAEYTTWRDYWLDLMKTKIFTEDGYHVWQFQMPGGAQSGDPYYGGGSGDPAENLQPSDYVTYTNSSMVHLWAEGLFDDVELEAFTGHTWYWMPLSTGYTAMEGDSTVDFGNSMGGGTGSGDVTVAGLTNSDFRGTESQNNMMNRNFLTAASLVHPEALQMAQWVYENIEGTNMSPSRPYLPVSILAGLIRAGES